jgi:hypothetical protein
MKQRNRVGEAQRMTIRRTAPPGRRFGRLGDRAKKRTVQIMDSGGGGLDRAPDDFGAPARAGSVCSPAMKNRRQDAAGKDGEARGTSFAGWGDERTPRTTRATRDFDVSKEKGVVTAPRSIGRLSDRLDDALAAEFGAEPPR